MEIIKKMKMTRNQFASLLVVIILISMILSGKTGIIENTKFSLIIVTMIVYVGILPYLLGIVIQFVFRKKTIPPYYAWLLAFIAVTAQWTLNNKKPVGSFEEMTNLIMSFIVIGVFVDTGFKSCRALIKRRKTHI